MKIGIIKNQKKDYRVGLVPADVKKLVNQNFEVTVESKSGLGCGFSDLDYVAAGAKIVKTKSQVFSNSTLIIKVGTPSLTEIRLAQKYKCVISGNMYLSFHSNILFQMVKRRVSSLAFESYEINNEYPIAKPLDVAKGHFIANLCMIFLTNIKPNRLGKTIHPLSSNEKPIQITILNDSITSREVAKIFLSFSANVSILENREPNIKSLKNDQKILALKEINHCNFSIKTAKISDIENAIAKSNIFIYTQLSPDANAAQVITEKMISSMPKGSVFFDLLPKEGFAISGNIKAKITNKYSIFGNKKIRYQDISALYANSVSVAISKEISDLVCVLAKYGSISQAIKSDEAIKRSIQTFEGELTSPMIAANLNLKFTDINKLLK